MCPYKASKASQASFPTASFVRQTWHTSHPDGGQESPLSKTRAGPLLETVMLLRFRFYNWVSTFSGVQNSISKPRTSYNTALHILQTHWASPMQSGIHRSAVQVFYREPRCAGPNLISSRSTAHCYIYFISVRSMLENIFNSYSTVRLKLKKKKKKELKPAC